jgi:hypothetical protein
MVRSDKIKQLRASAIMEYMTMIVFLCSALLVFQHYVMRGMSGNWKAAGDVFGVGRQYDPRPYGVHGDGGGTLECFYAYQINAWVSKECYNTSCADDCAIPEFADKCKACLLTCSASDCQDA